LFQLFIQAAALKANLSRNVAARLTTTGEVKGKMAIVLHHFIP